jgi:SET domain-containing protein 6
MVATHDIKAGDQIWNTYGDLPNSHLLRRYGYVDIIPCPREQYLFPFDNPADEVEIRADLVMDICVPGAQGDERVRKIDTWINLGGDE